MSQAAQRICRTVDEYATTSLICYRPGMLALFALAAASEWDFEESLAISWFGKGLRGTVSAEDRFHLYDKPGDQLFGETFVAPGAYLELTPAYVRVGPRVHFKPIAVFELSVEALWSGYFGTFSGVTDFAHPDDDYSEEVMDNDKAVIARARPGQGWRFAASPTLQARAGKVIIALPSDFYYMRMTPPDGATGAYWYEPQFDAMLGFEDVVMINSGVVFWSFKDKDADDSRFTWVGAQYTHQYVFGTEDRQQKVGPMIVIKPAKPKWVPTIAAFAQAWVQAPTREILPPYIAAALIW